MYLPLTLLSCARLGLVYEKPSSCNTEGEGGEDKVGIGSYSNIGEVDGLFELVRIIGEMFMISFLTT